MTISQWFIETGISPTVVPQVPLASLSKIFLRNPSTGQVVEAVENGQELSVASQMSVNDTSCFDTLDAVEFQLIPADGEFLHFLVAIEPLTMPSAIYFYYDYPSFGMRFMNLTELNARYQRGFAKSIGNTTVQMQEFYRHQYVVLVFKTAFMLQENGTEVNKDVEGSDEDLPSLLTSTKTGQKMGAPIVGMTFQAGYRNVPFAATVP
ncbi:Protein F23H11.7 [Aphelenchoides avenae]|nr:Protein F23H11.7 [Aphelenchus avenae]